jgi:hypothetical protein
MFDDSRETIVYEYFLIHVHYQHYICLFINTLTGDLILSQKVCNVWRIEALSYQVTATFYTSYAA